ncbi:MAG: 5'-methylthioadenosine/adenosylhomocysteine nucleosidase [Desulfovibrio sp.]
MKNKYTRFGIVAAMEEEITLLLRHMSKVREHKIGVFIYYTGNLHGMEVGVILCGIGKVNASVGTTILIERFEPHCLINTGVAGAIVSHAAIGDIILATEVRHHDVDATAFNYEMGQIPEMPAAYCSDNELINLALKGYQSSGGQQVLCGQILSGDSFIHTKSQIDHIEKNFPQVMAVEMEGAAIAQVAYTFSLPFLIIRSVSDRVYEPESCDVYTKCMEESANNSVQIVLGFIKNNAEVSCGTD